MSKPNRPPPARTNLASCAVATIFLAFVIIVALIVFFTVLKPHSPQISVNAVNFPSFAVSGDRGAVNFTFSQYVAVSNPNRAVFSHYDSSLQLLHSGDRVGFMFVPAGQIGPGRTQYMAATFAVRSFKIDGGGGGDGSGYMEMETRMEMAGRVRVLHFFTHHVEARVGCRVAVGVSDGSVLGFHC